MPVKGATVDCQQCYATMIFALSIENRTEMFPEIPKYDFSDKFVQNDLILFVTESIDLSRSWGTFALQHIFHMYAR